MSTPTPLPLPLLPTPVTRIYKISKYQEAVLHLLKLPTGLPGSVQWHLQTGSFAFTSQSLKISLHPCEVWLWLGLGPSFTSTSNCSEPPRPCHACARGGGHPSRGGGTGSWSRFRIGCLRQDPPPSGGGGAWDTSGTGAGCACGRSEVSHAAWLTVHRRQPGGQLPHRVRLQPRSRGRGRPKLDHLGWGAGPRRSMWRQGRGVAWGGQGIWPAAPIAGPAKRPAPGGSGLKRFPGVRLQDPLAVEGLGSRRGWHDLSSLPASGCGCHPSLTRSLVRGSARDPGVLLSGLGWLSEFPGTQTQFLSTLMQRLLGEQSLFSDSGLWLWRVFLWGFSGCRRLRLCRT
jgi:hypothetical protein